jgi:hypothetical protein
MFRLEHGENFFCGLQPPPVGVLQPLPDAFVRVFGRPQIKQALTGFRIVRG